MGSSVESGEETSLLLSLNKEMSALNKGQGIILGEIKTLGSKITDLGIRQDRLEVTHVDDFTTLCKRVDNIEKRHEGEDAVNNSNEKYRNRFYALLSFVLGALSVYVTWKSIGG